MQPSGSTLQVDAQNSREQNADQSQDPSAPDNRLLRLYVETYGCQMNEYDSGLVRSILGAEGYRRADGAEDAGVILLNTCAIREKAHEKVYNRLEALAYLKRREPRTVIGVLGCMAQNLGDDLFAQGLPVDFIAGPDNYRELPRIIRSVRSGQESAINITQLSRTETYEELEPSVVSGKLAFVTIMRGCDNFCSFCVVPYTRGRERSRSAESVIREINRLVQEEGVREVTLLGQNVNSYRYLESREEAERGAARAQTVQHPLSGARRDFGTGLDRQARSPRREGELRFTDLIERILDETNIARIRFTSPHPHDFPEELLELMAREPRFCSYIHLPLQSGATSVLERMQRDYSREEFLALVARIRKRIPDVGLSTDIIVGFCGESAAEFEETLEVVEAAQFDMAFMFRYSEREMTRAKRDYPDDVPEDLKLERLNRLIALQQSIAAEKNQREIGREHVVLIEGRSKRSARELMGRNSQNRVVIFPAPTNEAPDHDAGPDELIGRRHMGRFARVRVSSATAATLRGEFLEFVEQ